MVRRLVVTLLSVLILATVGVMAQDTREPIPTWLAENTLSNARIGIAYNAPSPEPGEVLGGTMRHDESAVFAKGFRLDHYSGCSITLRNPDLGILEFLSGYPKDLSTSASLGEYRKLSATGTKFSGKLILPLDGLRPEKPPYLHTKKKETVDQLGTWRVRFESASNSLRSWKLGDDAFLQVFGLGEGREEETFSGDEISFTFDDRAVAQKFYDGMSQAIRSCGK